MKIGLWYSTDIGEDVLYRHLGGRKGIAKNYLVNERIRVPQVRVIGNAGEQLGIMTTVAALRLAREQELDLVEVAHGSNPTVCRILDHGKLKYLQAKKGREARKAQKSNELREVRFRPNIAEHDFAFKMRVVHRLLANGDKVKVSVMFRGRENARPEQGLMLLKRASDLVKEEARLDRAPLREGRFLSIILMPSASKPVKPDDTKDKETVNSA